MPKKGCLKSGRTFRKFNPKIRDGMSITQSSSVIKKFIIHIPNEGKRTARYGNP